MFRYSINLSVALLSITLFGFPALASESDDHQQPAGSVRLVIVEMDAIKGKALFIEKACITCHAINGVGGEDGPPIGADSMDAEMNVFEFAARMWNRSHGMWVAQMAAFDELIELSGPELAHIIAFAHDVKVQETVTEAAIPPRIKEMMRHGHGDEDDDHDELEEDHHDDEENEDDHGQENEDDHGHENEGEQHSD